MPRRGDYLLTFCLLAAVRGLIRQLDMARLAPAIYVFSNFKTWMPFIGEPTGLARSRGTPRRRSTNGYAWA